MGHLDTMKLAISAPVSHTGFISRNFCFFETVSFSVSQDGLEIVEILLLRLEYDTILG